MATVIAGFGNERRAMGSKDEMREVLTRRVERGELPGVVALVSRRGQVQVDVVGAADATSGAPMRRDTLFRVSSMTKPERLFEPLGMKDTSFFLPESGLDRLATSYIARDPFNPDVGGYELYDAARGGQWSRKPAFLSGAAGLVSTADDSRGPRRSPGRRRAAMAGTEASAPPGRAIRGATSWAC
jgi:CubicO group peptidase (beta-lactamase class C family)